MLFRLWNYARGYVIIIVEGFFIEKFINICARRRILLWNVRIQKEHRVTARMSISGFRLIRPVARKTGCRVRLLKKTGLPFVFNKYRRRKAFFAGAVLFFILLNVLASFIWSIEISG
ncbi:MAG: sporulation protein YqfD, partial [Acetivibrionales bacterium]